MSRRVMKQRWLCRKKYGKATFPFWQPRADYKPNHDALMFALHDALKHLCTEPQSYDGALGKLGR